MPLPLGEAWAKLTPDTGLRGLVQLALGALYQVYARRSAGPDEVMIEKEGERRLLCLGDIKPRGLIVLPYVTELSDSKVVKSWKPGCSPQVWIQVETTRTRFQLEPISRSAGGTAETADAAEEGEGLPFAHLFWYIYNAPATESVEGLVLSYAELSVPVSSSVQVKDACVRAGMAKASGAISVWVPYLWNRGQLHRGDSLWCNRSLQ